MRRCRRKRSGRRLHRIDEGRGRNHGRRRSPAPETWMQRRAGGGACTAEAPLWGSRRRRVVSNMRTSYEGGQGGRRKGGKGEKLRKARGSEKWISLGDQMSATWSTVVGLGKYDCRGLPWVAAPAIASAHARGRPLPVARRMSNPSLNDQSATIRTPNSKPKVNRPPSVAVHLRRSPSLPRPPPAPATAPDVQRSPGLCAQRISPSARIRRLPRVRDAVHAAKSEYNYLLT